jgi:hypothetical protein
VAWVPKGVSRRQTSVCSSRPPVVPKLYKVVTEMVVPCQNATRGPDAETRYSHDLCSRSAVKAWAHLNVARNDTWFSMRYPIWVFTSAICTSGEPWQGPMYIYVHIHIGSNAHPRSHKQLRTRSWPMLRPGLPTGLSETVSVV